MVKRVLLVACLMLGCGDPNAQYQRSTGPVEVIGVRRFNCVSENCLTDLLLKTPNNVLYNLHLERSMSLPPVWPTEHCNIVYIQVPGDEHMRVLWATELK